VAPSGGTLNAAISGWGGLSDFGFPFIYAVFLGGISMTVWWYFNHDFAVFR
jgi:hypothetical protein